MSKKEHVSATPATMWLKQHKVPFEDGIYEYVEHGGTAQAAACFGVDEHNVVKTLIMQDEHEKPLVILMHGDREVSTKNLARQTNRKHIEPCNRRKKFRLSSRGNLAVRYKEEHAGLRRKNNFGFAVYLYQRRQARL